MATDVQPLADQPSAPSNAVGTVGTGDDSGAGESGAVNSAASASSSANKTQGTYKARPNPLDPFVSYTYNHSLYLVKDTDYTDIVEGRKNDIAGSQLIARSGGSAIGQRNKYFADVDMTIDNLEFVDAVGMQDTGSPHAVTEIKFTILEPYGITFLDRLQLAVSTFVTDNPGEKVNYFTPNFLLVTRFYGYDEGGNLLKSKEGGGVNTFNNPSDRTALIEKLLPFKLTACKVRVGAKIAEYSITGASAGYQVAAGAEKGVAPINIEVTASNLNDLFNGKVVTRPGTTNTAQSEDTNAGNQSSQQVVTRGICQAINDQFQKLYDAGTIEIPDKYTVVFDKDILDKGKVVVAGEDSKESAPMSNQKNTKQASTNSSSLNKNNKLQRITAGTPLMQFIDLMVRNSEYIKTQQNIRYKEGEEDPDTTGATTQTPIRWFRIVPYATPLGYDRKRQNYAYDITYYVRSYIITEPKSKYFDRNPWPGPHKIYDYSFTGKNVAVLSFEIDYNYLFFTTFDINAPKDISQDVINAKRETTYSAYRAQGGDAKIGSQDNVNNPGAHAAGSLYSPADTAKAKIRVIGDPDFILQDGVRKSTAFSNTPFLSDGSINSNRGEIYVMIRFLKSNDYNLDTGVMTLDAPFANGATYSKSFTAAYRVNSIRNFFRQGRFEQELDLSQLLTVDPDNPTKAGDYDANTGTRSSTSQNEDQRQRQETNASEARQVADGSVERTSEAGAATVAQGDQSPTDARRDDPPRSETATAQDSGDFGEDFDSLDPTAVAAGQISSPDIVYQPTGDLQVDGTVAQNVGPSDDNAGSGVASVPIDGLRDVALARRGATERRLLALADQAATTASIGRET